MTIPGIIMTCFIGTFFIVGILSSRMERRQKIFDEEKKAQQNAAEKEAKQDKLLFFSSVSALHPDSDAALRQLMTRFCWAEIIGTIGLSRLHLSILQKATHDRKVTLPNMQADRYEASEKFVAKEVHKTTTPLDNVDFYGVDTFAQEPTAKMLRDLINSGSVIPIIRMPPLVSYGDDVKTFALSTIDD